MKKKGYRLNLELATLKINPKDYIGYLILIGFLSVLILPASIFVIITFVHAKEEFQLLGGMIIMILPAINIISLGYLIMAIVKIRRKRLYLEITNDVLRFKGIIYERQIVVQNIKTVKKISGARRMESILIKGERKTSNDSRKIKVPLIWFSDRDIDFLLDHIKKRNKSVIWNGF